jgi:lipoprotein signal peptidase
MENWVAVINAQSATMTAPVDVQDPSSSSMQIVTLAIFGMISYIGFRYALKKAGGKDPIIASLFGAIGAMVDGYIIARFVLDRIFSFPTVQTVEIAPSEFPPINVNATLLVAVVLVLVVYGIQRTKPPAKKG